MSPLPKQAVFGVAAALFGVCLLGLFVGVHDSLDRPSAESAASASAAITAMRPGMASAVQAQPLKPDALTSSSAPASQLAQAAKPKLSSDDEASGDDDDDTATGVAKRGAGQPEPPALYSPDASPPPPPPPAQDNTPPF